MHSIADSVNQGFVFAGSILAEKKPTRRFPTGFGRVINIFCMIAVIVVTVMAYETLREGWHLLQHTIASHGFWLNVSVLLISIVIILEETRADYIKFRVCDKLLEDPDISDVTLGIIEDNGVQNWTPER
jgi:divalent metal cation (Fe/Co/Zn/Cd) transporter